MVKRLAVTIHALAGVARSIKNAVAGSSSSLSFYNKIEPGF